MQQLRYHHIPAVAQFKKDSSVTFAVRSEDKLLIHLDWLLDRYHYYAGIAGGASTRRVVMCDLFHTANYWIKSYHEQRPGFAKGRYPAVAALFEAATDQLARMLHCPRAYVGKGLEEVFGRDLTPEGAKTDNRQQGRYYSEQERALYRIRFKRGVAYHFGFDADPDSLCLRPLESADFYQFVEKRGPDGKLVQATKGWGPFVMTLEREFFMSRHWLNVTGKDNVFHSAYTAGGTVAAAGTMEVKNGVITGLRSDSGHYKPLDHNFAGVLLALQMFGVPMAGVKLYNWKDDLLGTAKQFMDSRMTWAKFKEGRTDFITKRPAASRAAPVPGPGYTTSPASGG